MGYALYLKTGTPEQLGTLGKDLVNWELFMKKAKRPCPYL